MSMKKQKRKAAAVDHNMSTTHLKKRKRQEPVQQTGVNEPVESTISGSSDDEHEDNTSRGGWPRNYISYTKPDLYQNVGAPAAGKVLSRLHCHNI